MLRKVDKHSGIPAYIQIENMIKSELLLGHLQKGAQLPTIRELQNIFDVNINTVLKALERLKAEGYIQAEQGVGYFIKKDVDIEQKIIKTIRECVSTLKKMALIIIRQC